MGPLSAVTQAMRDGARTVPEIQRATGLSRSTISAALGHLSDTGYLASSRDSSACTSCAMHCTHESATCGRGLTTLTLKAPGPKH
ncbi:helix-turn-helix domain-containing protein [Corynebacterium pelargi]|uniref:HTH marR-type domain-containing protein n=1 Tax=Corynebacterium pelargi TaxID=1471400 RepID=A0A410W7G5_9CORY|nr:helix-turn-helix domain-containing protein [Corynebacterium pelargi]QAU51807.1 hypothetical protein CPELA_02605 [Corynebacterium pelargi]GGG72351.1 hypothetical protein GCM10007338_06790 [Corynebacterium pelargi]